VIADVDGLDLLFVGPSDLAASLGVPFGDERAAEAAASAGSAARAAGRAAGIWVPSAAAAAHWFERGFQLAIVSSDLGVLADGLGRLVDELAGARSRP
jgi:4-hydroxy-2-oxoheptanedioate aldolase